MPIHRYIETVIFIYLNLFDACDVYQTFSLGTCQQCQQC